MTDVFVRDYLSRLQMVHSALDIEGTARSIDMIQTAWESGRQIITMGNGGSALTALHYINDWNKAVFLALGPGIRPGEVKARLEDIAPTVLHALGVEASRDYDGERLPIFDGDSNRE